MQPQNFPSESPVFSSFPQVPTPAVPHQHSVQFYENEHFLAAAVADFLAEGLNGGQIVIVIATTAHREAFHYRLKAKGLDPEVAVRRNQLVWLDPGKLETIFQPFVQLAARPVNRPDGVGLGLSISRELARGMQGDLVARSVAGQGAMFTLTLPIA